MPEQRSPAALTLHGSLNVGNSNELKEELRKAIQAGDEVRIDIALVEDLDLACLQVFYAAEASARAVGKALHFIGAVPPKIAARLVACGFLRRIPERVEELDAALVGL